MIKCYLQLEYFLGKNKNYTLNIKNNEILTTNKYIKLQALAFQS